jgi:hypothetical protein
MRLHMARPDLFHVSRNGTGIYYIDLTHFLIYSYSRRVLEFFATDGRRFQPVRRN